MDEQPDYFGKDVEMQTMEYENGYMTMGDPEEVIGTVENITFDFEDLIIDSEEILEEFGSELREKAETTFVEQETLLDLGGLNV